MEKFTIERFFTPFDSLNNLLNFDRIFGLRANHRKYKLLPICTSGSSYRVYYLKIEDYKLADTLKEFILTFNYEKVL